jgi:hypothetical protein
MSLRLPAQIPAQFSAEQADKADQAELKKWDFVRVFENLPI